MLNAAELELNIGEEGRLEIPTVVLERLGIRAGDKIKLLYLSETEVSFSQQPKEFFLTGGNQDMEQLLQEGAALCVSDELLNEAGIAGDADLEVAVGDREIRIYPAGAGEHGAASRGNTLPSALSAVFTELEIPAENIRVDRDLPEEIKKEEEEDGETGV